MPAPHPVPLKDFYQYSSLRSQLLHTGCLSPSEIRLLPMGPAVSSTLQAVEVLGSFYLFPRKLIVTSKGVQKSSIFALRQDQLWGVIYATKLSAGSDSLGLHLPSHPCLASSPFLSCFPYSLTDCSYWDHFLNKGLAKDLSGTDLALGGAKEHCWSAKGDKLTKRYWFVH